MHIINITVRNKVAVTDRNDFYVCGNSDYVIHFDFDEEWNEHGLKTARLIKEDGTYTEQVFTRDECQIPIIENTYKIMVGVYAGNLSTTTPAYVPAKKSILCGGGVHVEPEPDVYNQIIENLDTEAKKAIDASIAAEEHAAAAKVSEDAARLSEESAKGSETVAKEQATLAEAARAEAEKNLESTKMYARDAVIARGDAQIFKNQAQKAQTAAEASASLAEEHATAAGASANLASQKAAEAREYSMGASAYKSQAASSAAHASTYREAAETAAAAAEESAEASKLHSQAAEEAAKFAQGAAEKGWMYVEGRDDGYLYLVTSDNAPDDLTLKDDGEGRLVAVYG